MSAVGITENVKGDIKKFEVWYNGREEVYIIQVCGQSLGWFSKSTTKCLKGYLTGQTFCSWYQLYLTGFKILNMLSFLLTAFRKSLHLQNL